MKKVLVYFIAVIGGLSAVIVLIFTGAQVVVFDESRFHDAYEEYDRYEYIGIEKQALHDVTHGLLEYLKGNREDLVMYVDINGQQEMVFEEREQQHMVDVLYLFDAGFTIRNVCAVLAAALFALIILLYKKSSGAIIARGYLTGFTIFFLLLIGLGIAMAIDFNALFIKFHLLLFDNDLWLLDPHNDIMIQMFPEEFFNGLGMWIGIYALALITIPAACAAVYLKITKKRSGENAL